MAKSQANNGTQTANVDNQTIDVEDETVYPQEKDEFCSPEFLDPNAKLPRIQALRGTSPKNCGYFISVDQMAMAGWKDFDEKHLTEYTYESSGETEQGILIQNPRMLVCPKTPVLGYDRKLSLEPNASTVILGKYNAEMKEDENVGNMQFFQVFLLDKDNQPLHQIPLLYRAAGANQASFSVHWQEFCKEINNCHSIVNGIAAKQKNNMFYSLAVFCFKTAREQAGSKQKSPACKVVEHEVPTLENWRNYFIGFNKSNKEYVWDCLEPKKPMAIPGVDPVPMISAAPDIANLPPGSPNFDKASF